MSYVTLSVTVPFGQHCSVSVLYTLFRQHPVLTLWILTRTVFAQQTCVVGLNALMPQHLVVAPADLDSTLPPQHMLV